MNNNDILNQVERLCGKTTLLENGWNHFVYHHLHYVNIPDCKYGMIRIVIPNVCETNLYNERKIMSAINETNREVPFVKAVLLENRSISLDYDYKIFENGSAGEIVPHMIDSLNAASDYIFRKLLIL